MSRTRKGQIGQFDCETIEIWGAGGAPCGF